MSDQEKPKRKASLRENMAAYRLKRMSPDYIPLRGYVPRRRDCCEARGESLFGRCVLWLLPWTRRQYPGVLSGLREILRDGGVESVGQRTLYLWRMGVRRDTGRDVIEARVPVIALRVIMCAVESRVTSGEQLLRELRGEIARREAEPRRPLAGAVLTAHLSAVARRASSDWREEDGVKCRASVYRPRSRHRDKS